MLFVCITPHNSENHVPIHHSILSSQEPCLASRERIFIPALSVRTLSPKEADVHGHTAGEEQAREHPGQLTLGRGLSDTSAASHFHSWPQGWRIGTHH